MVHLKSIQLSQESAVVIYYPVYEAVTSLLSEGNTTIHIWCSNTGGGSVFPVQCKLKPNSGL